MGDEHLDESEQAIDAALREAARANPDLRDELLREWVADEREAIVEATRRSLA